MVAFSLLTCTGLGLVSPVVQSLQGKQTDNMASRTVSQQQVAPGEPSSPRPGPQIPTTEELTFETHNAVAVELQTDRPGTPTPTPALVDATLFDTAGSEALAETLPAPVGGTGQITARIPTPSPAVDDMSNVPEPSFDARLGAPVTVPAGDIESARAAYERYRGIGMPDGGFIPEDLIGLVTEGFPASAWGPALAVSWCESRWGGDQLAFAEGHPDAGWFQINRYWHEERARSHGWTWEQVRFDMTINVAMAVEIFTESGWGAWTCNSVLS